MASTSCSERALALLSALRRGGAFGIAADEARSVGDQCPGEFFRIVIESLADSFDPQDAAVYERLMRLWIPRCAPATPTLPGRVETVYVLSRVTLGSDIKIASVVLDGAKRAFPAARIVFAGSRKSAELFAADERVEWMQADYPRSGPIRERLDFAEQLRARMTATNRIVIDPDSRFTQLGLIAPCEPERHFHFPSRTIQSESRDGLEALTREWMRQQFGGTDSRAYIAPMPVPVTTPRPCVAVSLGVGGNESKRLDGDFETRLIGMLADRFATVWIDRGAGGEERERVDRAAAGVDQRRLRFWDGPFAGFASVISQCDAYVGYDSAGQHAAAAAGVDCTTIFAGAPNERFRQRWRPEGKAGVRFIVADGMPPDEVLAALSVIRPEESSPGRS